MPTEPSSNQICWILDREAAPRRALARATGLPADRLRVGAPGDAVFAGATPVAIVIVPRGDFEEEARLHPPPSRRSRIRPSLPGESGRRDRDQRLFSAREDEIADERPDPHALRALIRSAAAHRNAAPLAARHERDRITERFSSWFGALDVPGLLRALDPRATLPLLVRGVPQRPKPRRPLCWSLSARRRGRRSRPGSRGGRSATPSSSPPARLARRRSGSRASTRSPRRPSAPSPNGCASASDREASAFASSRRRARAGPPMRSSRSSPLPSPCSSWTSRALRKIPAPSGPSRNTSSQAGRPGSADRRGSLADDALTLLEDEAWIGDRSAIETLLWTALAGTSRDPLRASDLDATGAAVALATHPVEGSRLRDDRPLYAGRSACALRRRTGHPSRVTARRRAEPRDHRPRARLCRGTARDDRRGRTPPGDRRARRRRIPRRRGDHGH